MSAPLDPYAGLVECPVDDCEPDDEGMAHGVPHIHVIDLYMVRAADLRDGPLPDQGPLDGLEMPARPCGGDR